MAIRQILDQISSTPIPKKGVDSIGKLGEVAVSIGGQLEKMNAQRLKLELQTDLNERDIISQEDIDQYVFEKKEKHGAALKSSSRLRDTFNVFEKEATSNFLKHRKALKERREGDFSGLISAGLMQGMTIEEAEALIPEDVKQSPSYLERKKHLLETSDLKSSITEKKKENLIADEQIRQAKKLATLTSESLLHATANALIQGGDLNLIQADAQFSKYLEKLNEMNEEGLFSGEELKQLMLKSADTFYGNIARNIQDATLQEAFLEQHSDKINSFTFTQIKQSNLKKQQNVTNFKTARQKNKLLEKIAEGSTTPTGQEDVDAVLQEFVNKDMLNLSPSEAMKVESDVPGFENMKNIYAHSIYKRAKNDPVEFLRTSHGYGGPESSQAIDWTPEGLRRTLPSRIDLITEGRNHFEPSLGAGEYSGRLSFIPMFSTLEISNAKVRRRQLTSEAILDMAEISTEQLHSNKFSIDDLKSVFSPAELWIGQNRKYLSNPGAFSSSDRMFHEEKNKADFTDNTSAAQKAALVFFDSTYFMNNDFLMGLAAAVGVQLNENIGGEGRNQTDRETTAKQFITENFEKWKYEDNFKVVLDKGTAKSKKAAIQRKMDYILKHQPLFVMDNKEGFREIKILNKDLACNQVSLNQCYLVLQYKPGWTKKKKRDQALAPYTGLNVPLWTKDKDDNYTQLGVNFD